MRVLFPFVADTFGGSHASTLALAEGLRQRGVTCTFAVQHRGRLALQAESLGFSVVRLPAKEPVGLGQGLRYRLARARNTYRFGAWLTRQTVDIVHTQDLKMNLLWGEVCRRQVARHVWHQRMPLPEIDWKRRILIKGMTVSDQRLFISNYVINTINTETAFDPVLLKNPIGVPFERMPTRERTMSENAIVGLIANYLPRKRFELLLDAAAHGATPYSIRIAGKIPEAVQTALTQKVRDLGLSDRVTFDGPVEDPVAWMDGIDVLVCPAVREAFGRTLIEGMARGCIVVASATGGHLEIVRPDETGLFFPPDDIAALTAQIDRAIAVRATWPRAEIQRKVFEEFGVAAHAAAVHRQYESLLG